MADNTPKIHPLPPVEEWIPPHGTCPIHPTAPVHFHGCTVEGCPHNRAQHEDAGHFGKELQPS